MAIYGNGTHDLLGVGGTEGITLSPGTTNATFNLAGLFETFNFTGLPGANVTINNNVSVGDNLNINTNGGHFTLNSAGLDLDGVGTVKANINDGGSFTLGPGVLSAGVIRSLDVQFGPGGGTYNVGTPGTLDLAGEASPFASFGIGDTIDDASLGAITGYTISKEVGGVQTITIDGSGGHTLTFDVDGDHFANGTFGLTGGPLSISGDDITVCFLGGTHIRTPEGDAPVESLKIGDPVVTADGRILPVRWVGVDTVSTLFADPLRVMPIRMRAGSLGENVPSRDLFVSPDHAMFIEGVLVQAGALVNGVSITRETNLPHTFKYYHLEFAEHCLILAEGAPTETFIDNVDRMSFDNWAEHRALFGDINAIVEMDYPRAKSARQVPDAVKAMIAARQAHFLSELATAA